MSVAEDLEKRERQAGNAETGNIGQADYDEKFNKIAKDTTDEDFDDIINNNYGNPDKKNTNYNSDDYVSDTDIAKEKEENPASLYKKTDSASESPSGGNFLGKRVKKFGPFGGVVGLILFAIVGVSGGTDTLAASLLINIKEMLHSDRADGTRANQIFARATIAKKIDYKGADCGKIAIKCRLGTMSDNQRQNYERAGFKIEGKAIGADGKVIGDYKTEEPNKNSTTDTKETTGSRYIMDTVTFPDGKVVTTGDGFFKYTQANVKMRIASVKAFNPRSAFFLNNRFTDILGKTFGFSKGKVLTGQTKEEVDKSFNDKTGGATEEELKANTKPTKTEEAAKDVSGKIKSGTSNGAGIAGGAVCQAYNLARYGIATVKIARMYELVSFALPWLQAADQIKDQGKISPEVVAVLSNRLVSYQHNKTLKSDTVYDGVPYKAGSPNPKYNLTATDSQGYQIAAYKDKSKLKNFAKKWLLGGDSSSTVSKADSTLKTINTFGDTIEPQTGEKAIRSVCKVINSTTGSVIGIVAVVANCLSTIVGNFATGPEGCIAAAGWIAAGAVLTYAINTFGEDIIKTAVEEAKLLNLGSDLNGVDAGDAMAAGVGLMLGATSTASGLRPSTSVEESQEYIAYTEDVNNEYIAAEQYDARDRPFDITDQYSFLGSIVSKIQPVSSSQNSLFSTLASLPSVFSSSIISSSDTASALYSQPSFSQTERYDCSDTDLTEINMIGDKFCNIATVMPTDDLKAAQAQVDGKNDTIDKVVDYMTTDQNANEQGGGTVDDSFGGDADSTGLTFLLDFTKVGGLKSNGRSVDDNGKPIAGTQYALYLKYCTDARVTGESQTTWDGEQGAGTYWGTSKTEIEKDSNRDQDWYTGKQCTHDSTMMQMFRQYTNYCLQNATMDESDNCWEDKPAGNTSNSACAANGDSKAIYTCALKYDDYGYLWGGGHGGSAKDITDGVTSGSTAKFTPILDCSGLVRVAFVEAMGIEDEAYTAPGGYDSSKYWQKIPLEQAQQGDIVTSSGHVAIVESNDAAGKKFKIFDAETAGGAKEDNIRHSSQSYSGTIAAYRAIKVTSV